MLQQPTSLLSLPDELLVEIFDYLAEPLQGPGHPLFAAFTVCRRIHKVAKPLLYRDVVLGKNVGATLHIEAAMKRNPSLGQLVSNLELHDYGSFDLAYDRGELSCTGQATLRALTKLTRLTVAIVEPDEAASTLAALPSTPLQSLDMQLVWTEERSYWQDLRNQLFRFSGLRILKCEDLDLQSATSWASVLAREHRFSAQRLSLPALLELHMTDYIFLAIIGGSAPLRQILPSLLALHITITRPENAPAITTDEIAKHLDPYGSGDFHAADYIRRTQGPRWPIDGTADGLQLALADANANGIRVTGTALDCIEWHANFDRLLADRMMERAHDADGYAAVLARFGEEVAVAWLEEHAPDKIPLLHART